MKSAIGLCTILLIYVALDAWRKKIKDFFLQLPCCKIQITFLGDLIEVNRPNLLAL